MSGKAINALVVGASGAIGEYVVEELLEQKEVEHVTILVRRETGLKSEKLREEIVDFENISPELFQGVTHVFCCLGSTIKVAKTKENFYHIDHDYTMNVAQLAKKAGCQHFLLVTSVGASPSSAAFYLKVKGQTEEDCKALDFPRLSIFRPGCLDAQRSQFRLGEAFAIFSMKYIFCCFRFCCGRVRPIRVQRVAQSMAVDALDNAEWSGVRVYDGSAACDTVAHVRKAAVY